MTLRRNVLTTLGTVSIGGLAGCSALPFGGDQGEERENVSLPADTVEPIEWSKQSFPATVPSRLADVHHDRARELLAAVPSNPSVPNSAIAEELQSDREHAAGQLDEDINDPWPTQELSQWRDRRHIAATVRGAYRAATGEDDTETVTDRQQTVRDELYSFLADHEYRASSPLDAVLAHTPIEELVADCRQHIHSEPAYPADPIADPFQAGDAVGKVELTHAMLADARRLREVYLTERSDVSSQRANLIDTSDRLRIAIDQTHSTVYDFFESYEPPRKTAQRVFDADLTGTAGRELFVKASQHITSANEEFKQYRDDGNYAMAVIEAGQTLAAIEALRATIDGIRNGSYQNKVTVESVIQMAERTQEAILAIDTSENPGLAMQIGRPALDTVNHLPEHIERQYTDAVLVEGELAWADLYARAVPAVTAFVSKRLE